MRLHTQLLLVTALLLLAGCAPESDASNAEPMLIEPRMAVGRIRHGMSVEELVAVLGEPGLRTKNSLVYPKLGLAVMPDLAGRVQIVLCGDVMGLAGPFVEAFNGRTKAGIGMHSTRQEVVAAFGEPSSVTQFSPGIPTYKYAHLGMDISLEKDKVFHIIVRLLGPEEDPRPGITIDLADPPVPQ